MNAPSVLIVDDDPDMRRYVRACLEKLGVRIDRVLEATDGLEALTLIRSGAVDAVIVDVGLPRMGGRDLCRAIREDPALRDLPLLLMSGIAGPPSREHDADGFLAKPFNARQLHAALERVLAARWSPRPDTHD